MTIWIFITEAIIMFYAYPCFSTNKAYVWFIVAVLGIMIREDKYGIASCIRSVGIDGKHYGTFDHFFHSFVWGITPIRICWHSVVSKFANLQMTNGKITLLIDLTLFEYSNKIDPITGELIPKASPGKRNRGPGAKQIESASKEAIEKIQFLNRKVEDLENTVSEMRKKLVSANKFADAVVKAVTIYREETMN